MVTPYPPSPPPPPKKKKKKKKNVHITCCKVLRKNQIKFLVLILEENIKNVPPCGIPQLSFVELQQQLSLALYLYLVIFLDSWFEVKLQYGWNQVTVW